MALSQTYRTALIVIAGFLLTAVFHTGAAAQADSPQGVRNVVIVHGAWADGSSWSKVIPLLQAKGLHVVAVQNPLTSLADDVAATKWTRDGRLPRLMGRGRALEALLGADDIPGDLAERYGYVNRSFPDADLDAFVESLATRIASFDKRAISETKRFADVASLPPDFEIAPEWDVCLASIMRPAAQERIKQLMDQGFHQRGDVEERLGFYVGQLGR